MAEDFQRPLEVAEDPVTREDFFDEANRIGWNLEAKGPEATIIDRTKAVIKAGYLAVRGVFANK